MSYVPPQTTSYAPAVSYAPPAPAQSLSYMPPATTQYAAPVATYAAPAMSQMTYSAPKQISYAPPIQAAPSFSPMAAPMSIAQPMIVAPQIGFGATSAAPSLFSQQPSFAPPVMGGGHGAAP